jgi:hypothetical protein
MNTRFTQGHLWAAHYGTPCWHALLLLMLLLWLEKNLVMAAQNKVL